MFPGSVPDSVPGSVPDSIEPEDRLGWCPVDFLSCKFTILQIYSPGFPRAELLCGSSYNKTDTHPMPLINMTIESRQPWDARRLFQTLGYFRVIPFIGTLPWLAPVAPMTSSFNSNALSPIFLALS